MDGGHGASAPLPTLRIRNDGVRSRFDFQTADARPHSRGAISPELCPNIVPRKIEGAGKAGRLLHPQRCVQNKNKHTSVITTGSDGTTRPSPRNGFTAYFVISPVERACCHRRLAEEFC